MNLSFDKINSLLVHPYKGVDDPKLKKNLDLISRNFTTHRQNIGDYLESDEMVSAYTSFYLPTNAVKLTWLLEKLPQELQAHIKQMDLIDVGAGPGTYSASFLSWAGENYEGKVTAFETSLAMGKQAEKTIRSLFPFFNNFSVNTKISGDNKKILLFGNSMNEMGIDKALNYLKQVDPEIVILLEPGTKDVFKLVLSLREKLIEKKYSLQYPCPGNQNCPMQGQDDWCHQLIHTTHEPTIEQLSQIISLDRRTMPLIAHLYVKSGVHNLPKRIVRNYGENKFSFNFQVCEAHEGNLQLYKLEVMKKHYNKSQQKEIDALNAGDSLTYEKEKELGPGMIRGKIV